MMRASNYGDLQTRLTRFIGEARPYLAAAKKVEVPASLLDAGRLADFIAAASEPLEKSIGWASANPWQIAGLGHNEVRVSSVLARLWDRRTNGHEGAAFLARFLARAGEGLPTESELAGGYKVQTEHCVNGSVADRVDITVETRNSIIGIEIKIYAAEGQEQLARYARAIETRARLMRREHHHVIFLSPYTPKGAADGMIHVTWRALAQAASESNRSTHGGWLISQFGEYCRNLRN